MLIQISMNSILDVGIEIVTRQDGDLPLFIVKSARAIVYKYVTDIQISIRGEINP